MIEVRDMRAASAQKSVSAENAEPGRLYQTETGAIVMVAKPMTRGVERAFGARKLFVTPDGVVYIASGKLIELASHITWTVDWLEDDADT